MFQLYHGYILHSKIFPTTPHTPKSELKRRSYDPDKLDIDFLVFMSRQKKLCRDIVFLVFFSRQKKLCHDIVFLFFMLRQKILCRDNLSGFYVMI